MIDEDKEKYELLLQMHKVKDLRKSELHKKTFVVCFKHLVHDVKIANFDNAVYQKIINILMNNYNDFIRGFDNDT